MKAKAMKSIDSKVDFELVGQSSVELLRGGGPKKKAKKPSISVKTRSSLDESTNATSKASQAQTPTSEPRTSIEAGQLIQEHWNVPVRKAEDMQHGQDGVCIATKFTFTAKYDVLRGANGRAAMLVPIAVDTDTECPVVVVWAKQGAETKQHTFKLVQVGSQPVEYSPPAARGIAPTVTPMTTLVLELPRRVFKEEKDWKQAVLGAEKACTTLLRNELQNTQWNDTKVARCMPRHNDGQTTSLQAFVRIPTPFAALLLRKSGTNDANIFVRPFVDKTQPTETEYTNLWLDTPNLEAARIKYHALPRGKTYGMVWSAKDYAVRVLTEDAPELAPIATGRSFILGERYEIHGVPRDWQPNELFDALASTDNPWPKIQDAHVLNKKPSQGAYRWLIKAPEAPPTPVIFLDDYVLSVKKFELRPTEKNVKVRPKPPTLSAWMRPPLCPGDGEPRRRAEEHEEKKEEEKTEIPREGEKVKEVREEKPMHQKPRSRSPRRAGAPTVAAAISPPTTQPALGNEMQEMKVRMDSLMALIAQLTQQVASLQLAVNSQQQAGQPTAAMNSKTTDLVSQTSPSRTDADADVSMASGN